MIRLRSDKPLTKAHPLPPHSTSLHKSDKLTIYTMCWGGGGWVVEVELLKPGRLVKFTPRLVVLRLVATLTITSRLVFNLIDVKFASGWRIFILVYPYTLMCVRTVSILCSFYFPRPRPTQDALRHIVCQRRSIVQLMLKGLKDCVTDVWLCFVSKLCKQIMLSSCAKTQFVYQAGSCDNVSSHGGMINPVFGKR